MKNFDPSAYFHSFKESYKSKDLPEKFNYPFYYKPHTLCLKAAEEVQEYIKSQSLKGDYADWQHDFGIDHFVDGVNVGKMFGVLIVEKQGERGGENEIGFITAFSGKLGGKTIVPYFVPPIVDMLTIDSFFKKGEQEIESITKEIQQIEKSSMYLDLQSKYKELREIYNLQITKIKEQAKEAKAERQAKRKRYETTLTGESRALVLQALNNESAQWHFYLKDEKRKLNNELQKVKGEFESFTNQLSTLKKKRLKRSQDLQSEIFNEYQLLNVKGETKSLLAIFEDTVFKIPPSGAGECALPKLLQFAFQQNWRPIVMAEFWWGQSPKSEVRKHGFFYPSCKGKCFPILGHMLDGVETDKSELEEETFKKEFNLEILYEDDTILAVNKPENFLSVPGKYDHDSVSYRMNKKFPKALGNVLVHRLDRGTSGILLVTKTKEAHENLQKQFANRTIKKEYIAILDGEIKETSGEINLPLRPDLFDRPRQLVCHENGKEAISRYQVLNNKKLENGNTISKVKFFPLTGRTHQLRMHAAHHLGLNTPILGDDLYGQLNKRMFLHASKIIFEHPNTGESLTIECPPDF